MRPIYEGNSAVLQSPTGTGKSLCILLPMLTRLLERMQQRPRAGLRMLMLVPSPVLQLQMAGWTCELLGERLAKMVRVLRRDVYFGTADLAPITIATPRQVLDYIEDEKESKDWRQVLGHLDMLVFDEADRTFDPWTRRQRFVRGVLGEAKEPGQILLETIAAESERTRRREPVQIVAASATINRKTERSLRFCANQDFLLIRAAGQPIETTTGAAVDDGGQYGDGTSALPPGLVHTLRVPIEDKPFHANYQGVLSLTARTIYELESHRTLVIVCNSQKVGKCPASVYPRSRVESWLRSRMLEAGGYAVEGVQSVVEASAANWRFGGGGVSEYKQVIVGDKREMRGLHIENIDAVVLVGCPESCGEYIHAAGRTSRYHFGSPKHRGGSVVTICPDSVAHKIFSWAKLAGFKVVEEPADERHPRFDATWPEGDKVPLPAQDDPGAYQGVSSDDELEALGPEGAPGYGDEPEGTDPYGPDDSLAATGAFG
uniref:Helicase ATP-binding domain-containing protein n=1 Tax=Zooxanthella nutricula TaxID=1333877 RepID=A0A7S2NFN6_9DINO